jgi:hypothetical protein
MKALEKNIASRVKLHPFFVVAGVPLVATSLLYLVRLNDVSPLQFLIAFALLLLPWQDYRNWRRESPSLLPVFAMLAFMYWLYYAIPLFLEDHVFSTVNEPIGHELAADTITLAILMVLLGVCSLWLGMKSGVARLVVPRSQLSLELTPSKLNYVRGILIVGSLLSLSDMPVHLAGEGGRQLIGIMVTVIPILAFAILFRNLIRGQSNLWDKILVLGFLMVRLVAGLASGWLAVSASILVICGATYLMELRRVPRAAVILVLLFTLFFQFGKEDFRKTYWQSGEPAAEQEQGGRLERVSFWVQSSLSKWTESLSDPTGNAFRRAISPSVSRFSLLNQSANVIELTPAVVPYQYGWLYSYMAITWIPRFIWPDKPSMSEANQYYQVAYGLSTEEDLSRVSISVGLLTEGFINFGWAGVVGIMFLAGIFFDFYQKTFLSKTSGALMTGIGVILLPQFLSVESQVAQYVGGILQEVVVTLIVMLPIIRIQGLRSRGLAKPVKALSGPAGHVEVSHLANP